MSCCPVEGPLRSLLQAVVSCRPYSATRFGGTSTGFAQDQEPVGPPWRRSAANQFQPGSGNLSNSGVGPGRAVIQEEAVQRFRPS